MSTDDLGSKDAAEAALSRVATCEKGLRLAAGDEAEAPEEWGVHCWAVAECDSSTVDEAGAHWVVSDWHVKSYTGNGVAWVRGRPDHAGGFGEVRVEYSDYGFGGLHTLSPVEIAAAEGTSGDIGERAEEISVILRAWLLRAVDHHAGVGPDWPGVTYPDSGPQPQFVPPTVRPPTAGPAEVARTVERFAEDLRHSETTSTEPPAEWGLDCVATASCDAFRVRDGDPDWLVTQWRVRHPCRRWGCLRVGDTDGRWPILRHSGRIPR